MRIDKEYCTQRTTRNAIFGNASKERLGRTNERVASNGSDGGLSHGDS